MRRLPLVLAVAAGFLVGAWTVGDAAPGDLLRTNNSGGNQTLVPKIAGTPCWRLGSQTFRPDGVAFSACTATTTTTTLPATTTVPTTSTTTIPPTSTSSTSSTLPASTTTTPGSGDFVETFDNNTGLDRFRRGVFHRDVDAQGWGSDFGSWSADHDIHQSDCGDPHTNQHTVTKANRPAAAFVCRDHLMTTMGDVDSYSIVWFSPNQVFDDQTRVAWDVTVTNLGARQWWEVMIVSTTGPDLACVEWLPCNLPAYPAGAVVVGNGPFGGGPPRLNAEALDWQQICNEQWLLDAEGCASKSLRRQWSVTDNQDGTLTIRFNDRTYTRSGSFPDGPFKVIFKDHNYTPDKDGVVGSYTWHWDNIAVT